MDFSKINKSRQDFLHFSVSKFYSKRKSKTNINNELWLMIYMLKYLEGNTLMSAIYFEEHEISGWIEEWLDG